VLEYDYDIYNADCTAYVACPRGLIDYQCQWDHSCYIRLLTLVGYVFATAFGGIAAILIAGKLFSLMCACLNSLSFIYSAISIISSVFKCCSFGMFERDVVVQVEEGETKKLTDRHQFVRQKLMDLDLQVNFDAIDDFKLERITQFMEDYDIEETKPKEQKETVETVEKGKE
jgi:hypothetical protein